MWFAIIIVIISVIMLLKPEGEIPEDAIVFTSAFTRGADPTAPERLVFTKEGMLVWMKNRGYDYLWTNMDKVSIPFQQITGMRIHTKMIGVDIQIIGKGVQQIYATKFTSEDAKQIETILNKILTNK
jgi:hypothetical protein